MIEVKIFLNALLIYFSAMFIITNIRAKVEKGDENNFAVFTLFVAIAFALTCVVTYTTIKSL